MLSWRVTKYDPSRRDAAGRYPVDEWTSVGEIGRVVGGVLVTPETYVRVEEAYLATALSFHADAGHPTLRALGVEAHSKPRTALCGEVSSAPLEGAAIPQVDLPAVIRACLRERFWCRLESTERECVIHFGYDLYLYLAGSPLSERTRDIAAHGGLFIEPFTSPYAEPSDPFGTKRPR